MHEHQKFVAANERDNQRRWQNGEKDTDGSRFGLQGNEKRRGKARATQVPDVVVAALTMQQWSHGMHRK